MLSLLRFVVNIQHIRTIRVNKLRLSADNVSPAGVGATDRRCVLGRPRWLLTAALRRFLPAASPL